MYIRMMIKTPSGEPAKAVMVPGKGRYVWDWNDRSYRHITKKTRLTTDLAKKIQWGKE